MTPNLFLSDKAKLIEEQKQPDKHGDHVKEMVRSRFCFGTEEDIPKAGNTQTYRADHKHVLESIFFEIRHCLKKLSLPTNAKSPLIFSRPTNNLVDVIHTPREALFAIRLELLLFVRELLANVSDFHGLRADCVVSKGILVIDPAERMAANISVPSKTIRTAAHAIST